MDEQDNGEDRPVAYASESDDSGMDLISRGIWHAPHGPKTRAVAWVILTALAVCLVTMLVLVVVHVFF